MKEYQAANIRNIVVAGHGSEGKTTLAESMLFLTGAVDRQGRIEDGSTVSDFDPEEIKRTISISASVAPVEFGDKKLNIIDTPGFFDFAGELIGPARVTDAMLIVIGSVPPGLAVGTDKAWAVAEANRLPKMIVINGMDRENANYSQVVEALKEKYGAAIAPIQAPIYEGGKFIGVADMLSEKAHIGIGKDRKETDIPAKVKEELDEMREMAIEAAASADEALMEKYFEEGTLERADMLTGLKKGLEDGSVVPVVCLSALSGVGVRELMETIVDLLHSPADKAPEPGINPKTDAEEARKCDVGEPFSALVFKTMADPFVGKLSVFKVMSGKLDASTALYNANTEKSEKVGTLYVLRGKKQINVSVLNAGDIGALAKLQNTATGHTLCDPNKPIRFAPMEYPAPSISMAVYAAKEGDEDKVFSGLSRLMEEDPTIAVGKDPTTTETLLSGQGETHLDVVAKKLKAKFGAEARLQDPRIPYRETIRKTVKAQGRHKKQSGGHGQFGDVWIEFSPIIDGSGDFVFEDKIVGGVVPKNFIPAVEKGLRENIVRGVLAGYPMVNLKATLYDGSYHAVDSSEMAFKTAARLAYKKACAEANPALLEPMVLAKIVVPDEYSGTIMGDMNKRRGRVMGMEPLGNGQQQINAEVPQSEMFKYATDLRSMTQGRGSFSTEFVRYEEVPANIAQKVIDSAQKDADDDE